MNARSVYVKLHPAEVEALGRLAQDQRRRPQDQAAYLLSEALKQAAPGRAGEGDSLPGSVPGHSPRRPGGAQGRTLAPLEAGAPT